MTAKHIAGVALTYWRAQGARTRERLDSLVRQVMATYYGPDTAWADVHRDLCASALDHAHTAAWELRS